MHTYGHKLVASEAFTAGETGGNRWDTDPNALKRLGDLIFCSGVNRFILHATTLQRRPQLAPGLTFGKVGSQFSRTVTWWDNGGKAWFQYLRCQWLLQQGLPVADVCVLASESTPPPTYGGSTFPDVPHGYDFDLCSTDALLHRMTCRDGRLVLPDGMSYRLLLLPKETAMTPQVLRKLQELANARATIVGANRCARRVTPAIRNAIRKCAASPANSGKTNSIRAGAWPPQRPRPPPAAFKLKPDFEARGHHPQIAYKHRSAPDAEIFFVSHQKYFTDEFEATFRVSGKTPELWNPETGAVEKVPLYREEAGRTVVPLRLGLAARCSWSSAPAGGDHLVPRPRSRPTSRSAQENVAHPQGELRLLRPEESAARRRSHCNEGGHGQTHPHAHPVCQPRPRAGHAQIHAGPIHRGWRVQEPGLRRRMACSNCRSCRRPSRWSACLTCFDAHADRRRPVAGRDRETQQPRQGRCCPWWSTRNSRARRLRPRSQRNCGWNTFIMVLENRHHAREPASGIAR